MISLVYYLIAGSIFSAIIDVIAYFTSATRMNNLERVYVMTLWPLGAILFIYLFIKELGK